MNWDEEAEEAAQPFGDCRSHDMRFVHGAQWQREQLRTPEAIEKAADILSFETTGGCYPKADEQCRHVMRRVLETLLGED